MNEGHKIILEIISDYLEKNPDQRFGQALANLKVNQFANQTNPGGSDYNLRDIYNDADHSIIHRMQNRDSVTPLNTEIKDNKEVDPLSKILKENPRHALVILANEIIKLRKELKEHKHFNKRCPNCRELFVTPESYRSHLHRYHNVPMNELPKIES